MSQFNSNPYQVHMDSETYVLQYLKHTESYGIWLCQGENCLHGTVVISEELCVEKLLMFMDANWVLNYALKPRDK